MFHLNRIYIVIVVVDNEMPKILFYLNQIYIFFISTATFFHSLIIHLKKKLNVFTAIQLQAVIQLSNNIYLYYILQYTSMNVSP